MSVINQVKEILSPFRRKIKQYSYIFNKRMFGHFGKNVALRGPINFGIPKLVYLYDDTTIRGDARFIFSPLGGKFILKRWSGAASGLTVINQNHTIEPAINKNVKEIIDIREGDTAKDIVIEEEVWIGANVTLLPGTRIGRGAIIGAGAVCRSFVPPYSIAFGNPCKVINFKYSVDEIIEHEALIYKENERYPRDILEKNYEKFFLKRIKEIKSFVK